MIYTFVFGAPVAGDETQFGKLERIVLNNGIANQITVNPGLLGYERVVPISDLQEATADGIRMNISSDEWKAYSAFKFSQPLDNPNETAPNTAVAAPDLELMQRAADTEHLTQDTGARAERTSVSENSVVLTSSTAVVDEDGTGASHKLKGVVADTGRPQQLLLDDGSSVPFEAISLLDEERIQIGGTFQQPILAADRDTEHTASRSGAAPRQ